METMTTDALTQELAQKAGELESQRLEREEELTDIILQQIAKGVESKEADIMALMAGGKNNWQQGLREVVVHEVKRSAEGRLWCPGYVEKLKSEQTVMVYTGSHWQAIEGQQWKDFVAQCAGRCGVPESQLMNTVFMRVLFETVAYNLAEYRRQRVPDGEVWLNLRNGTLVLRSDGSTLLREHSQTDVFTYTLPYCYEPQAECPLWRAFLSRVLPEADQQQLLAEFIGYSLMPRHSLERLLLLYGGGQNGKSVTLEVIEALLSSVNISSLSLSDLTNDDVKRAAFEGKMLNISYESGKDVNPNVLKQITSGERVTVKHLYRDPYETKDYGKLIAAFNILPRAENSFGFFRRLLILPYQVTISKEEIDRQLTPKLKAELPGILNWVLAVLPGLMTRGEFSPCASSELTLEHYRLQSDNVRLFLSEMCEVTEQVTSGKNLYEAYRGYCFASQFKPLGKTGFFDRLETLGHKPDIIGKLKFFKLRITEQ